MIYNCVTEDLLNVGSNKPMGYMPIQTLEESLDKDQIKDLIYELVFKGLTITFADENECAVVSGALYAWDQKALNTLLCKNKETLIKEGWPIEAEIFVRHSMTNSAEPMTDLFDLIADAYNDKSNTGRKNKGTLTESALPQ
jgi:hypothetical protein